MIFQKGITLQGISGGDDFVAVTSRCNYAKLCQEIIQEFDQTIPNYYTEEDVDRGFVEVANRRGIIEQFPLVSISIGVVEVDSGKYTSPLQIGEYSAQVKHKAKEIQGSTYVINRRRF